MKLKLFSPPILTPPRQAYSALGALLGVKGLAQGPTVLMMRLGINPV